MIRRALRLTGRTLEERATRTDASVISYYVTSLARVLRPKWQLLLFVLASAVHAVAHAFVALVAAALAATLARQWGSGGPGGGHVIRDLGWVSEWAVGGTAPASEALVLSGFGLAVVFVKGVSGVYATYVQARIGGELATTLRLGILDTVLACRPAGSSRHSDHSEASVTHTAQAVSALTLRVQDVEQGLGQGVLGGARAAAQLVPIAILLALLSPPMAAAAAGTLAGFAWALGRMRAGYRRATGVAARENDKLLDASFEAVRHADLWVAFGAEPMARERVATLGVALARGSAYLHSCGAAMSSLNEVLAAAALVIALAAERVGWLGPAMDRGTILFFAVAFFLAYRPLRELSDARLALLRASEAYRDLRCWTPATSLSTHSLPKRHSPPPSTPWVTGVLEIRGVRPRYGGARPLSLRVEPGTVVAIVGPTGIGKTSLLRVLLGLEASAEGAVLFDDAALDEAPAGPCSRPFAWVPQDAPLLADTLDANVQLGAPTAPVREVLASLGAAHLVDTLGRTRLGAGGRCVSGGERQWIALARAVATRLPVLLLDEPTSGLDAAAQRMVLAAIEHLRGHRTVILVTHRPEPLSIADVVVRLESDDLATRAA
jgi:ABC-type multidrug transport system fused ATPase/permease subunit